MSKLMQDIDDWLAQEKQAEELDPDQEHQAEEDVPSPPDPERRVIAIYHETMSHADAIRLTELLAAGGFPGQVVTVLVEAVEESQ